MRLIVQTPHVCLPHLSVQNSSQLKCSLNSPSHLFLACPEVHSGCGLGCATGHSAKGGDCRLSPWCMNVDHRSAGKRTNSYVRSIVYLSPLKSTGRFRDDYGRLIPTSLR